MRVDRPEEIMLFHHVQLPKLAVSLRTVERLISGRFRAIVKVQEPVSLCGAATGFDSGEPRKRRKIDRTTKTAVERNSDCQF
jgi:hypothetical protein